MPDNVSVITGISHNSRVQGDSTEGKRCSSPLQNALTAESDSSRELAQAETHGARALQRGSEGFWQQ